MLPHAWQLVHLVCCPFLFSVYVAQGAAQIVIMETLAAAQCCCRPAHVRCGRRGDASEQPTPFLVSCMACIGGRCFRPASQWHASHGSVGACKLSYVLLPCRELAHFLSWVMLCCGGFLLLSAALPAGLSGNLWQMTARGERVICTRLVCAAHAIVHSYSAGMQ
jgi:hypothetical protein